MSEKTYIFTRLNNSLHMRAITECNIKHRATRLTVQNWYNSSSMDFNIDTDREEIIFALSHSEFKFSKVYFADVSGSKEVINVFYADAERLLTLLGKGSAGAAILFTPAYQIWHLLPDTTDAGALSIYEIQTQTNSASQYIMTDADKDTISAIMMQIHINRSGNPDLDELVNVLNEKGYSCYKKKITTICYSEQERKCAEFAEKFADIAGKATESVIRTSTGKNPDEIHEFVKDTLSKTYFSHGLHLAKHFTNGKFLPAWILSYMTKLANVMLDTLDEHGLTTLYGVENTDTFNDYLKFIFISGIMDELDNIGCIVNYTNNKKERED